MHHHHRGAARGAYEPDLDVARSRAAPAEAGGELLGGGEQAGPCRAEALHRGARVGDVDELDLADHCPGIRFCREAAARPRDQGRIRGRRDHRRLLDHHRNHVIAAVHLEVERHPEGERERADGVLDHDVGDVERQRVGRVERLDLRRRQVEGLGELLPPLRDRQPVERLDP